MKRGLLSAVLVGLCVAFVGCRTGGEPGKAEIGDNIDFPFVNDPRVIGTWESVDFVTVPGEFIPSQRQWKGDLFLESLMFLEDGRTPNDWQTWTKGVLIHKGDRTASHYEIKALSGTPYLFLEWKSGDYALRGMTPKYYVLKKK